MRSTHPRPSWPTRLAIILTTALSLTGLTGLTGVVPAQADVYESCTVARCSDARSANATWAAKGYPRARGWYPWPGGQYNYAGGRFRNRESQLPSGGVYQEYDVYPRERGARRDAYRIVVDPSTGVTWFSPNHYTDFYRL
ncbi:ribonuclease domain-containing protein [Micrococcus luteus]|uniref:ribonuclease domain-containing protein n=1 Tax=Micrococcus luteus TaxID=1270 RepID=UPI00332253C1